MSCRNVERFEIVVGRLDFGAVFDRVSQRNENAFNLGSSQGDRMFMADPAPRSRKGHIEGLGLDGRSSFVVVDRLLEFVDRRLDRLLQFVAETTELGPLFLRQVA